MAYDDTVGKDTAKETEVPGEPPENLRQSCYIGAKGRQNLKRKS